jgi:hypothetical protein
MNGIEMVDVFIINNWSEQYFKYLKVGEVFKLHRHNDGIEDKNIWIVTSNPYKNKNNILTIDCEEFKGELDFTPSLNWILEDIKSLKDRITALEIKIKPRSSEITIYTEIVGLEEANKLAKELKNTLDSMEIKFKVGQ